MSLKARSPAHCLRQDWAEPSVEETPHLSAQEDTLSYQLLKVSKEQRGLEQCFSNPNAHVSRPGVLRKGRLIREVWWGLRCRASNRLLRKANAAGPWTSLTEGQDIGT